MTPRSNHPYGVIGPPSRSPWDAVVARPTPTCSAMAQLFAGGDPEYEHIVQRLRSTPSRNTPRSSTASEQTPETKHSDQATENNLPTPQSLQSASPLPTTSESASSTEQPRLLPSAPAPIVFGDGGNNIWRMLPSTDVATGLGIGVVYAPRPQFTRIVNEMDPAHSDIVRSAMSEIPLDHLSCRDAMETLTMELWTCFSKRRAQLERRIDHLEELRGQLNKTYTELHQRHVELWQQMNHYQSYFGPMRSQSSMGSQHFGPPRTRDWSPEEVRDLMENGRLEMDPLPNLAIPGALLLLSNPPYGFSSTSQLVKNLVSALGACIDVDMTRQLAVDLILNHARELCLSPEGNRLCQTFLDRADPLDRERFIEKINQHLIELLQDKHRARKVIMHAAQQERLQTLMLARMQTLGAYETLLAGGVCVWRDYLVRCRMAGEQETFEHFAKELRGKWADLCCAREEGTIAVQQLVETLADDNNPGQIDNPAIKSLMGECLTEIIDSLQRCAADEYGHFTVERMLDVNATREPISRALVEAEPPIARTIHGASVVVRVFPNRNHLSTYIRKICTKSNGADLGIVTITKSPGAAKHNEILRRSVMMVGGAMHKCGNVYSQSYSTVPKVLRDACLESAATIRSTKEGVDLHAWATGSSRPMPRAYPPIAPRLQEEAANRPVGFQPRPQ
ncbi:hypothetical protein M231_06374 [Tremella mesenterica]|uniref:PUM-HD domain-containing protein n=1 Tax=Tremella mesenterica TaxID=5217 RepID=A0A4Q1BDM1_TREME|nr:hypothetical protein M231_06374 [Tremella mesenterica]